MSTTTIENQDAIAFPLGHVATGLYIVTAGSDTKKTGMLASWVVQAGFEPPMIAVAISPEREMYRLIQETKRFTVNILGKDNTNLMKPFGKYNPDQFDGLAYKETGFGADLTETLGSLHVELENIVSVHDHHLVIGQVKNGTTHQADADNYIHIRKSGFNY